MDPPPRLAKPFDYLPARPVGVPSDVLFIGHFNDDEFMPELPIDSECPIEPHLPAYEPRYPEKPFIRAESYFPEEMHEAMPVRPRRRVAIVENRGFKDLFKDSFAKSHLV